MYHNWRGQKFIAIDEAHRALGEVVRIGPNTISFSSIQAYKDIYGHGSQVVKDVFYDNQAGGNPSMADTSSRELHSRKRKNLSFVFAAKQVTSMEPRVMDVVDKLLRAVKVKSQGSKIAPTDRFDTVNGALDIRPWLNMFTYDAISSMFFSNSFKFLDRGDDDCMAQDAKGGVRQVHAMQTFHTGARLSVLLGHMPGFWYDLIKNRMLGWTFGNKCGTYFTGMARYLVTDRLQNPPSKPDLFSNLPVKPTEKNPVPMELNELIAESAVMLNAGNDTTQTSLVNILYSLASNPKEQGKLRRILEEEISTDQSPIVSYAQLQHIPYLRYCIDESFRVLPPVATGLPRRTTQPAIIAGYQIASGVGVSAPTYTLHRNEKLFSNAGSWLPERWDPDNKNYTDEERKNLKEYVQPFSQGARACIGRNLAYMELSICIAALVLAFEWELGPGQGEVEHFERFNCNPVKLMVRPRPRDEVWDSYNYISAQ
ncbi:hypothetical protein N7474_008284 [Penicillium riverlandense]|uniref:uncharacterized protein n=1 Tax=Penicillium riverlandense TaxID=1903569 RepID=UPI0025481B6A|nr:uncharacterized protein N7474_008284 [Penicillium riverlandense]KAJ5811983.1 hypothetical protein N7474_008284 [Penicillium riverlandense]